jgi:hypothetical protein
MLVTAFYDALSRLAYIFVALAVFRTKEAGALSGSGSSLIRANAIRLL